tara:strand:+ start:5226 stop:5459 length:234 start_codon:yes stop_codon:yes gene_type:complete
MHIEHIAENKVLVHKKSTVSGRVNSMLLPTTQGKIEYWIESGKLIQDVMPDLNDNQREFLMSGITPREWNDMFGEED